MNISESIMVSSYNDQNKGIYLKVSGDRVTVIGQSTTRNPGSRRRLRAMARNLDTFAIIETSDLHIKQYEYFAISVNDSITNYRNSGVLIVGTRNSTVMTLAVTQPVTTRVGDNIATLIPGKQYSFLIYRLQTVYLSSANDLTGTRIITNVPVSVFSGHEWPMY